ncbi:hypothetical protein ES703_21009 [subsurface metagenome]
MNDEVCKSHSGLVQMVTDVKDDTGKQWTEIDHIKGRPPVWCTAVIALLTGLLGSILTYAALITKLTQAVQASK